MAAGRCPSRRCGCCSWYATCYCFRLSRHASLPPRCRCSGCSACPLSALPYRTPPPPPATSDECGPEGSLLVVVARRGSLSTAHLHNLWNGPDSICTSPTSSGGSVQRRGRGHRRQQKGLCRRSLLETSHPNQTSAAANMPPQASSRSPTWGNPIFPDAPRWPTIVAARNEWRWTAKATCLIRPKRDDPHGCTPA